MLAALGPSSREHSIFSTSYSLARDLRRTNCPPYCVLREYTLHLKLDRFWLLVCASLTGTLRPLLPQNLTREARISGWEGRLRPKNHRGSTEARRGREIGSPEETSQPNSMLLETSQQSLPLRLFCGIGQWKWFQTSALWSSKRINSCCLKPLSVQ